MAEAMKYKIKNESLEKLVYSIFDKQDVQRVIADQIDDATGTVKISSFVESIYSTRLSSECKPLKNDSGNISIYLRKDGIEQIPEYNPNGWNKYPEVKPPKNGQYLAQVTKKNGEFSFWFFFWDKDFPWKEECVFRELPEPYLGEDLKEEVKDEEIGR